MIPEPSLNMPDLMKRLWRLRILKRDDSGRNSYNVTNFGAFVDIGVHQDGLVHISELADRFVDDPMKVVKVGQVVKVKVMK